MQILSFALAILAIKCFRVEAAKILGLSHIPSPSHVILVDPLFRKLAEKGHKVTVITSHPLHNQMENYTEIYLEEMIQFKAQYISPIHSSNGFKLGKIMLSLSASPLLSDLVLSNPKVQKLKSEHFDLVIQNLVLSDPLLGLAHHFKAPLVGFVTGQSNIYFNSYVGNPSPLSYVPYVGRLGIVLPATGLNFLNRVFNVLGVVIGAIFIKTQNHYENQVYVKHFPDGPPLDDLIMNVSLVFVNSHYSIESPRPYVPNMIQVGGMHIEEPKELPKDLREFLDGAEADGAIFFSLGSNFNILNLGKDKIRAIMNSLGNSRMKVLFKSNEDLKDVPSNVKIAKWLPQNDILAHPNVKLFISHGGLLSITEAVYHAVPVLGIPLFGDQAENIFSAGTNGYGVQVKPDELTEEKFSGAISEIINNPKYQQNINLKSSLLREQPIKPLDLAVFWVEHLLKHKGAAHLKNMGATLSWYQYHLIDVILFLTAICILANYVGFLILRRILLAYLLKRRSVKVSKIQHNKKSN